MEANEAFTAQASSAEPKFVYQSHDAARPGGNGYSAVCDGYLYAIPIDHDLAREYEKLKIKEEKRAFFRKHGEKRMKWVWGRKDEGGEKWVWGKDEDGKEVWGKESDSEQ
jgi:hypothetical protein